MPDESSRSPRFPYVGALLCAACVGMAAWTWMRYSWAWGTSVTTLAEAFHGSGPRWPQRTYAYFEGQVVRRLAGQRESIAVFDPETSRSPSVLVLVKAKDDYSIGQVIPIHGRIFWWRTTLMDEFGRTGAVLRVDSTASRFTGASIAGLVVGAMGVFVFAVALSHWLTERRAREAQAEEGPSTSPLRPE